MNYPDYEKNGEVEFMRTTMETLIERIYETKRVHIRLFGVDGYMVDVVDLYLVADLSSLLSPSKLRSEMVFEFPLSGVHQDLVNVLDMVLKVIDRCSSAVVDRRCPF
ncbi:hypothetical protein F2Q68_00010456 [Brassica cretica]|uniref:Uncharacterized protein n=1 Tax=Brassica cretica TaxID=69181 RepID=A0A8S9KN82_BRACR|nr:hypothetical protein F2Q68_00010456 [Brassica cretica]